MDSFSKVLLDNRCQHIVPVLQSIISFSKEIGLACSFGRGAKNPSFSIKQGFLENPEYGPLQKSVSSSRPSGKLQLVPKNHRCHKAPEVFYKTGFFNSFPRSSMASSERWISSSNRNLPSRITCQPYFAYLKSNCIALKLYP